MAPQAQVCQSEWEKKIKMRKARLHKRERKKVSINVGKFCSKRKRFDKHAKLTYFKKKIKFSNYFTVEICEKFFSFLSTLAFIGGLDAL
jgi:hypothetical protein